MKPQRAFSMPRPKPYYNFPVNTLKNRQTNISRISNLSLTHRPQSKTETIDITNQIHKYRDLLDGANDNSIMQFMNTLREGRIYKKKPLAKLPKTFKMLERKSVCQPRSKRVSDFSPEPRVSQYYQYWSKIKGSSVRDFVNFGCQLRTSQYQPEQNRKPFSYLRTFVDHPNLYQTSSSSVHCPRLRNTISVQRQNSLQQSKRNQ